MYAAHVRAEALALLRQGDSLSAVARATGVARSTLREWRDGEPGDRPGACPRCDDRLIDQEAYAALLGFYLGDGHIAKAARYYFLRITCDQAHSRIIDIRDLCTWALDLVDIPWRRSSWKTISVSRREAVAALDALIGPKS